VAVSAVLDAFAEEVGADGPVRVVGGRTRWGVGGAAPDGVREVRAPSGVVTYQPAEMTVQVGAGTTLEELGLTLVEHGQECALAGPVGATVGGAVAVGWNDLRRTRVGLARDALLQARVVTAEGRLVTAGGPTVKNVAGFDLCRLLVGSLGTLALVGEVILRTRPRPPAHRWLTGTADPFAVAAALHRPAAVLWDGTTTWVRVEGQPADVEEQARTAARLGCGDEAAGPPELPPHRWSRTPASLRSLPGDPALAGAAFVAEVGVGTVHAAGPPPAVHPDPRVRALGQRVKAAFDPTGRCNPGRDPWSEEGR
jgi:FAD/FMN-containing dehydrogenase